MSWYLISFEAHAMEHLPGEDMPAVAKAAHAVSQEAVDAGVFVCAGALEDQRASIVAADGMVTDGPVSGGHWRVHDRRCTLARGGAGVGGQARRGLPLRAGGPGSGARPRAPRDAPLTARAGQQPGALPVLSATPRSVAGSPDAATPGLHHRLPGSDEAGGLLLPGDRPRRHGGQWRQHGRRHLGEVDLAFQRVADYRPPRWPDGEHPKQYHLDFEVDESSRAARVVELGATLQKDFIGPDGYGWQVYTDPAGHPFCLCRHEGVTWTGSGLANVEARTAQECRRPPLA